MTGTEHIQQPRKRLFILLLAVGGTLILGLAFLLWWVIKGSKESKKSMA